MVLPAMGTGDRRGLTTEIRSALGRRVPALIIASDEHGAEVITRKGKRSKVGTGDLPTVSMDADAASVRIWKAAAADFSVSRVDLLSILRELVEDVAQSRALAAYAVSTGDQAALAAAKLTESENTWAGAHLNWQAGNRSKAVELCLALPPGTYPDLDPILIALWSDVERDSALQRLAEQRAHGSTEGFYAPLMRIITDPGSVHDPTSLAEAVRVLQSDQSPFAAVNELLSFRRFNAGMRALRDSDTEAAAEFGGSVALRTAVAGVPVDPSVMAASELAAAPIEVLDDLIDRNPAWAVPSWTDHRSEDRSYLRARLLPRLLTDQEVEELNFERESLRRAVLAGDEHAYGTLGASSDPELRALARLRSGDLTAVSELAELYQERGLDQRQTAVVALGHAMRDGGIDPRIGSDRSAWPMLAPILRSAEVSPEMLAELAPLVAWSSLRATLERVWEADWPGSIATARDVLRASSSEVVRDEALNMLAYALWITEADDAARAALVDAIEGERTQNLQINFALVVGSSDSESDKWAASLELARIACESAEIDRSMHALQRAVALWGEIPGGSEQGDHPPTELVEACRRFAVANTSEMQHDDLMTMLSWSDSEWLANSNNTAASPWSKSARHKYRVARAQGPKEAIAVLRRISESAQNEEDRKFAVEEATRTAETLITFMLGAEEPALGAAAWALDLFDAYLPINDSVQVRLGCVAAVEAARGIAAEEDGYPAEVLWERIEKAIAIYNSSSVAQDDLPEHVVGLFATSYAGCCMSAWVKAHDVIVDAANSIVMRIGGISNWRIDRAAVARATDPILAFIQETDTYMYRVRLHTSDDAMNEFIDEVRQSLSQARNRLLALPR